MRELAFGSLKQPKTMRKVPIHWIEHSEFQVSLKEEEKLRYTLLMRVHHSRYSNHSRLKKTYVLSSLDFRGMKALTVMVHRCIMFSKDSCFASPLSPLMRVSSINKKYFIAVLRRFRRKEAVKKRLLLEIDQLEKRPTTFTEPDNFNTTLVIEKRPVAEEGRTEIQSVERNCKPKKFLKEIQNSAAC